MVKFHPQRKGLSAQGRYNEDDAERGSAAAGCRETKHKSKSQFERKGSSRNKKPTNNNFGPNLEDTVAFALEKEKSNTPEIIVCAKISIRFLGVLIWWC